MKEKVLIDPDSSFYFGKLPEAEAKNHYLKSKSQKMV